MNILYICGYAANYKGNFIESLTHLDIGLHGKQQACYIFPPEAKEKAWIKELEKAGAKVFYNTGSVLGELKLQKQIVDQYSIDIIYHHFWNLKDCLVNRLLKMVKPNVKMVIHYHNEYHVSSSKMNEKIKHWILDADMNIGCGEYVAKEVDAAGYRNVKWIDNCIDFSRLDNWEKYEKPEGLNLLTFSSYGYEIKGVDVSIKAVYKAREEGIPANLLIAVAADWDGIKNRVQQECNGHIPEWIQLLPSRPDVATYYHAANAYLNSSRSEGLCYSGIEAIYCGAQVIQTNIPGNPTFIPHTYQFETNSVEQLVKTIEVLYNAVKNGDADIRAEQKQYVVENYGLDTWVKKEIAALCELMRL